MYDRILPCAVELFNHRQTATYRGRRSVSRTNQVGNVRTNDWPGIIQLQDCNGPGKNKAGVHIASQPFSPSLSKRFFSLPLPSIQKSSITSYPNGTSANNRGHALEMWVRLKSISREYYLVQQLFFNYKVTTARQLRISKGGTMGRMNLRQRSYSGKPWSTGKCVRVYIPALWSKGSQRLSILCSSAYDYC